MLAARAPIAGSTVTLWAATSDNPQQLAQARTGTDGAFSLTANAPANASLYLVASGGQSTASREGGDNPAIALIVVLGSAPPEKVVVNEFTTVASVWTHNQFLEGKAIRGNALGLKIAGDNVPSFVDFSTGGQRPQYR